MPGGRGRGGGRGGGGGGRGGGGGVGEHLNTSLHACGLKHSLLLLASVSPPAF